MTKLFIITEEKTRFGCFWLTNRVLCYFFGILQLGIAATSLSQHVYSVIAYRKIFFCQSNLTGIANGSEFLAYDVIIFDYGLYLYLLGTQECVANYLDGGYGRSLWCVSHTGAILILLVVLAFDRPKLFFYYPAILQQSVYALGLVVLTLATLPKLLVAIFAEPNPHVLTLIFIFLCGMVATWFFTLVLWHHYWHMETKLDEFDKLKRGEGGGAGVGGEEENDEQNNDSNSAALIPQSSRLIQQQKLLQEQQKRTNSSAAASSNKPTSTTNQDSNKNPQRLDDANNHHNKEGGLDVDAEAIFTPASSPNQTPLNTARTCTTDDGCRSQENDDDDGDDYEDEVVEFVLKDDPDLVNDDDDQEDNVDDYFDDDVDEDDEYGSESLDTYSSTGGDSMSTNNNNHNNKTRHQQIPPPTTSSSSQQYLQMHRRHHHPHRSRPLGTTVGHHQQHNNQQQGHTSSSFSPLPLSPLAASTTTTRTKPTTSYHGLHHHQRHSPYFNYISNSPTTSIITNCHPTANTMQSYNNHSNGSSTRRHQHHYNTSLNT